MTAKIVTKSHYVFGDVPAKRLRGEESELDTPICSGLRWTSEKPTEPGWYWVRGTGRPPYPESIVPFECHDNGRLFCAWDFPIYSAPYEWAGPIPSPNAKDQP